MMVMVGLPAVFLLQFGYKKQGKCEMKLTSESRGLTYHVYYRDCCVLSNCIHLANTVEPLILAFESM